MSIRFRLICFVVLVMVCGFSGAARSQIIKITDVQYKAGPPKTSQPKGTWSVPKGTWSVWVDFGYMDKGVYKVDATVSAGGRVHILLNSNGGNFNWASADPFELTNPKTGLHARARIEKLVAPDDWDPETGEGATAFAEILIPAPPGGGGDEDPPEELDPIAAIRGLRKDGIPLLEDVV